MTRPCMRKKWGRGPANSECRAGLCKPQAAKQSVIILEVSIAISKSKASAPGHACMSVEQRLYDSIYAFIAALYFAAIV